MKVYKIRNPQGLFSNGGSHPSFTKNGKSWSNIGHVKSHLGYDQSGPAKEELYQNCEVIVFESSVIDSFSVLDLINGKSATKTIELPKSKYTEELSVVFSFLQDYGIEVGDLNQDGVKLFATLSHKNLTYQACFKFIETNKKNYCSIELCKEGVSFFTQRLCVEGWNTDDFKTVSLLVQLIKNQMEQVSSKTLNINT